MVAVDGSKFSHLTAQRHQACELIGRFATFHLKGQGFESLSSRHVGTLGKSFTLSRLALWPSPCFGVKFQHRIHAFPSLSRRGAIEIAYMNESVDALDNYVMVINACVELSMKSSSERNCLL